MVKVNKRTVDFHKNLDLKRNQAKLSKIEEKAFLFFRKRFYVFIAIHFFILGFVNIYQSMYNFST